MFYVNFVNLCNSIGKSPSAVAEEIGIKRSTVTRWKQGKSQTDANIQKVASYFGVTVEELTAEKEKSPTPEGMELSMDDIRKLLASLPTSEILNLMADVTEELKKRG